MTEPIRVLLVEDTPIAQIVAKTQLKNLGCEVDIAADGFIALEKAMIKTYDLILMDIGLGDSPDGFEVTRQIKSQSALNKLTPIVAVTSHGGTDYQEKAFEAGMEQYFGKPFTPADAKKIVDYIKVKIGFIIGEEKPSVP